MTERRPDIEVRVGSVWEDTDKRMEGRRVRVEHVGRTRVGVRDLATRRTYTIKLERMQRQRGWRPYVRTPQ